MSEHQLTTSYTAVVCVYICFSIHLIVSNNCMFHPLLQKAAACHYQHLINYRISSNRSPRLLLEPPGSPMNMTLFKTPRFLVLYLLLQSEIPGRPYRHSANLAEWRYGLPGSANHTIRTNDAMHHSATGVCAISSMIFAFRHPGFC